MNTRLKLNLFKLTLTLLVFVITAAISYAQSDNDSTTVIDEATDPTGWPAIASYILNGVFLFMKTSTIVKIMKVIGVKGAEFVAFAQTAVSTLSDPNITPQELVDLRDKGKTVLKESEL